MEAVAAAASVTIEEQARWGLPAAAVVEVAGRLRVIGERSRPCFAGQTRDGSAIAWGSLGGHLTVDQERPCANSARRVEGPEADGQRVQHCMSPSPWSAQAVREQVRAEVAC
jgi:hypothetical protein